MAICPSSPENNGYLPGFHKTMARGLLPPSHGQDQWLCSVTPGNMAICPVCPRHGVRRVCLPPGALDGGGAGWLESKRRRERRGRSFKLRERA